jgi:hypothetical protein
MTMPTGVALDSAFRSAAVASAIWSAAVFWAGD